MKKIYAMSVIGGGLTGLVAALKLSQLCKARGEKLALIAPKSQGHDKRTTALFMPSIDMLKELDVWQDLQEQSAALKTMRLIDGSERLLRAPITDFKSSEMDLPAFGYNVPNQKMIESLESLIAKSETIDRIDASLDSAHCEANYVSLALNNGATIHSSFAIAAEGRHSPTREAAAISTRSWSYPQTAMVLNFQHSRPHDGISTEFHTVTGPFTQVPLPATKDAKHRSSLVWVVKPEQAEVLSQTSLQDLSNQIETKLHSCLGKVDVENPPQCFALSGMTARSFGKNRVALVGEAGHVFPPIGAQGFNLGLRDIWDLAECLHGYSLAQELDYEKILEQYNRKRLHDIHLRTNGVDLLNRSLLTNLLPVQAARVATLSAMNQFSWLRRFAMRQGLGKPSLNLKSLLPLRE